MEYIIIAIVMILLAYSMYFFTSYQYNDEKVVLDSITILAPSGSQYTVEGDTIEFRNHIYDFYNLDVTKANSSDEKVTKLLNHYLSFKTSTTDFKNETCYLITVPFEDDNGFRYHSMIIPIDSFNRDNLTFSKNCTVWIFDGKNREFVVDSAFNSEVAL